MRRKIRCDCKLRGLPEVQRVRVDAWLFEEGRTYEEVVEGCLREFGLKVSKSSVGRYYERISADRFAEKKRQEQMALLPELSPAEAYEVLLRRIGEIALEEMDQPLEEINAKVVVRLVRVLIAARREKHMEMRVWVERRKAENWMARECLRHWRREMKKQAHLSYLPVWEKERAVGETPTTAGGTPALPKDGAAEREKNASEDSVLLVAPDRSSIQANATEDSTLKRHECRAPGRDACGPRKQGREKLGSQQNPLNHFALDRGRPLVGTLSGKPVPTQS